MACSTSPSNSSQSDNQATNSESGLSESSTVVNAELTLELPTDPVSVLSAAAETYFVSDIETILQTAIAEHTELNKDKAEGVTISYSLEGLPADLEVLWARAEIFEKGQTETWKTVSFAEGETSTIIYN